MARGKPDDETARLQALYRYDVLDSAPEDAFDRVTRLARSIIDAPIALISLIDRHRQWFKSKQGFNVPETAREIAFCSHAIKSDQTLIVTDTHADPRFVNNPLVVNEPYVRFYVGVPLRTADGHNVGTLCAMDATVRELRPEQILMLEDLGRIVVDALELRRLAAMDSLTGALTRRSFYQQAARDFERTGSTAGSRTLSCAVIDVDNVKAINDRHGRAAGDTLLQQVVSVCKSSLRDRDYFGRIGGDEFALMLPDTLLLDAFDIVDRLRGGIAETTLDVGGQPITASVSIGLAECLAPEDDLDGLLRYAEAALQDAKHDGKNRVACHLADLKLESGGRFEGVSLAGAWTEDLSVRL